MSKVLFRQVWAAAMTLLIATTAYAQPTEQRSTELHVLFVTDAETPSVHELADAIQGTIREITGEGTIWEFSPLVDLETVGAQEVLQRIGRDGIDLVIGLGPASTGLLAESLPDDVRAITVGIAHPSIQGVPYRAASDSSGEDNFTYVWPRHDLRAEMQLMRSIRPVEHLLVVYSDLMGFSTEQQSRIAEYLAQEFDVEAEFASEGEVIAGEFSRAVDFAYLLDVVDIRPEQYRETVETLSAGRVPVFAYDRAGVEVGATASLYLPDDRRALIRRVALRALRVASGRSLADEPVSIDAQEEPTFNPSAAQAAGASIPYAVLLHGQIVDDEPPGETTMTLDAVVDRVLAENLGFAAQQSEAQATVEAIKQARARLLPSLTFQLDGILIDTDRARASLGQQPQFLLRPSLTLEQIIWAEPAYAGLDSQKASALAAQAELESFRLDLITQTVDTYVALAKLNARVGLTQDSNARLEARLRNAQRRYEVGDTGQADVFRLQSELANGRAELIDAIIQREQVLLQLNTLLNRPADAPLSVSDDLRENPDAYGFAGDFSVDSVSPGSLRTLRHRLTELAWAFAPELRQIAHAREAQARQLRSADRAYWNPTVSARGEIAYTGARYGVGSDRTPEFDIPGLGGGSPSPLPDFSEAFPIPDDWDWTVGVNLSLPLIRGGGRIAASRVAETKLAVIDARLADVRNQLELRVHNAANALVGKKLALGLAEQQVEAARQTFDLVSTAYAEGAATVVDVVDAETALRAAEISRTVAYYDIVAADFDLQRAIGVFARDMNPAQRQRILDAVPETTTSASEPSPTAPAARQQPPVVTD